MVNPRRPRAVGRPDRDGTANCEVLLGDEAPAPLTTCFRTTCVRAIASEFRPHDDRRMAPGSVAWLWLPGPGGVALRGAGAGSRVHIPSKHGFHFANEFDSKVVLVPGFGEVPTRGRWRGRRRRARWRGLRALAGPGWLGSWCARLPQPHAAPRHPVGRELGRGRLQRQLPDRGYPRRRGGSSLAQPGWQAPPPRRSPRGRTPERPEAGGRWRGRLIPQSAGPASPAFLGRPLRPLCIKLGHPLRYWQISDVRGRQMPRRRVWVARFDHNRVIGAHSPTRTYDKPPYDKPQKLAPAVSRGLPPVRSATAQPAQPRGYRAVRCDVGSCDRTYVLVSPA